jgi:hypothetical protein
MIVLEWNVPFIIGQNYDIGNIWPIDMRNSRYCPAQINSHKKQILKVDILSSSVSKSQRTLFISECVSSIVYNIYLRIKSSKCEGRNCNVIQKSFL